MMMEELSIPGKQSKTISIASERTIVNVLNVRTSDSLKVRRVRVELEFDGFKCVSYIPMKGNLMKSIPKIAESLQIELHGTPVVNFLGGSKQLAQNLNIL